MEEANIKLTALANSVRELSGTTSIKGIVEMTEDVTAANTEINEQADLIAQIKSAAEGLPDAGNGSGGGSVETCEVTIVSNGVGNGLMSLVRVIKDMNYVDSWYTKTSSTLIKGIHKGSFMVFHAPTGVVNITIDGGSVVKNDQTYSICFINFDAPDAVTVTLSST